MSQVRTWIDARPDRLLVAIGFVLSIAAYTASTLHYRAGGIAWLAVLAAWALLAFVALRIGDRVSQRIGLMVIIAAAVAMRLALLPEPPYLSSDMYRYVWDGRVQGAGINPYLYIPAAPELEHLRDTAIYPNINRADYAPTIYPPVAQMLFWAITRFSDSVVGFKLGLLLCEGAAIACMISILRSLSMPLTRVVAYAWHPLPVWEVAGNGHVDIAMLALLLAGVVLYLRARILPAGVLVTLAALIKPTALLAMPVLWRPWDWKLPAILVGVTAAVYVPYLSAGKRVLGFLGGYIAEEEFSSGGGFRYLAMLERMTGPIRGSGTLYVLIAALILIALALKTGFRNDRSGHASVRALGVLLVAFLVLLTPHYPWYYLALAPLLVFSSWLTPWVLTTAGFVLYDVIDGDHLPPFFIRETALHLLALAALAYDLWGRHKISALFPAPQEVRP